MIPYADIIYKTIVTILVIYIIGMCLVTMLVNTKEFTDHCRKMIEEISDKDYELKFMNRFFHEDFVLNTFRMLSIVCWPHILYWCIFHREKEKDVKRKG